ncbi:nucleolar protein 8 [Paramisgurnus dabryanus]|uniref:nucleolar protein 8 n=1 Tax=Paramisgurnus dabryanus TaxID=90735 RepID=UPI0031F39B8F
MKRLYIGGLGHTVSEKDLKDRFGKFGDVSDVEIITRKDEDGALLKKFGYVNINITDAEYKRCIGVLNKSTWKGGTLMIQQAKESFLHRLAEERQQIVEQAKTPKISPQKTVVETLKTAGVENFHMKAAVPGTEIPGHKDWVVSKFGRVLPVLNLKFKGKKKVFKYDPSKHCHNIKRLEAEDDVTPVSELTWEISGGDDEISKKRRGEFPKQKPCPKKPKQDLSALLSRYTKSAFENKNAVIQQNRLDANEKQRCVKKSVCVFDNDDSEDEIRRLVAEESLKTSTFTEVDEDNLEVVGDDFVVRSNIVWGKAERDAVKSQLAAKDDEEYDSADTDEILIQRKTLCAEKSQDVESQMKSRKANAEPFSSSNEASDEEDDDDDDSIDSEYEAMIGNCYRLDISFAELEQLAKNAEVMSDDEKKEEEEEPKEKPSVSNKSKGNNPEDILASILGDDTPEKEKKKKKNQMSTGSLPAFIGTKDLFGFSSSGPSEPSLKRTGETLDHNSTVGAKKTKQDLKLSPNHTLTKVQPSTSANIHVDKVSDSSSSSDDSSSEESEITEDEDGKDNQDDVISSKTTSVKTNHLTKSNHPVSRTDEKKTVDAVKQVPKKTNPPSSSSSSSSSEDSETGDEDDTSRTQLKAISKKVDSHPTVLHPTVPDAQKQLQDNQKRLAALEQRQKETEQQKKLIQGALSNVDNANRAKHIVFDSDEESDDTPDVQTASQKHKLFEGDSESDPEDLETTKEDLKEKSNKKPAGSKLFDSSDDEDEDDDDESDRFQIKPQFEGKAGQKLMQLQSRFGTDSRFQMDSRFLESDNEKEDEDGPSPAMHTEDELHEEKKKTLDILQSVLKTSIKAREPVKTKMFKDVSALHYDPTREEHAVFEGNTKQPAVKESKAARRKKREEAEKLPEVSKEIYFDVSADLKNVFGTSKDDQDEAETETEKVSWDKEDEDPEDETTQGDTFTELSFTSNAQTCEDASGGFKFSFFGDDAPSQSTSKTDEYKVETLKEAKFSWQVDPRFQDSSSDEEGVDEVEQDQLTSSKTTEEPTPLKKAFFFFHQDDERLKDGPGMFCRSVALIEQREAWEETRQSLKAECRKKHRDAKRRQRPSLKT